MNNRPFVQNLVAPSNNEQFATLNRAANQGNADPALTNMSQGSNGSSVTVAIAKATRPLNSFMAFRAYYAPIFTRLQQKCISGFLTYLWEAEFDKAKWSIIAKAYSLIRDITGKKKAPLDEFLAINAPFMGITEPGAYLFSHGWEIATGEDGCSMLRRTVEFAGNVSGSTLATTNASVDDVLHHSYVKGYMEEDVSDHLKAGNEVALTMATSAQPVIAPLATNVTAQDAVVEDSAAEGVQEATSTASTTSVMPPAQISGVSEVASPIFPIINQDTVNPGALHFVDGEVQGVDYPELGPISPLGDTIFRLAGEHPFNNEFMPTTDTSSFDPFAYDPFDAYHMSEPHDWSDQGWLNQL